MTSSVAPPQPGKINFAGMAPPGAKRRRVRSGENASSSPSSKQPEATNDPEMLDDDDEKTAQTSKCKGATTIPIFLKKTYKMIDTCDAKIASWTAEGDMFVVKDPDLFASSVIPQYFDHNKFSSFARQLNFYGFRKMQSKPIRNSDFDANTAKHVTFYNENFKRGRCDLLKKIQRSTRGGGSNPGQDQQREVQQLKDKITTLEQTITDMGNQMEERMRRLELDMLGRMEQMMLAMQQQQQAQLQNQPSATTSNGVGAGLNKATSQGLRSSSAATQNSAASEGASGRPAGGPAPGWDPLPYGGRGTSIGSISGIGPFASQSIGLKNISAGGGPTLPPHPKQKQLATTNLPGALGLPPARLSSLRGLSNLTRGISGLSRAASVESQSSALLSNPWEDKFFSMLMAGAPGGVGQHAAGQHGMDPTPMADAAAQMSAMNAMNAAMISQSSSLGNGMGV